MVDEDGRTPLILVAGSDGDQNMVDVLLTDPDINVNMQDEVGGTALIYAANSGHYGIVEALLKRLDIDVYVKSKSTKVFALIFQYCVSFCNVCCCRTT